MEPENPLAVPAHEPLQPYAPAPDGLQPQEPEQPYRGLKWIFIGPQGLRAGWSALIFLVLLAAFGAGFGFGALGREHQLFGTFFGFFALVQVSQ